MEKEIANIYRPMILLPLESVPPPLNSLKLIDGVWDHIAWRDLP
jgi:hypothetical protein